MKYQIVISEEARNSLLDSMRFLANVNKKSAKEVLNNVLKEIKSLDEFPLRHPTIDELAILKKKIYKFVLSGGRYILLYTVVDSEVYIYKFLDSRKENKVFNDLNDV